MVSSVDNGWEVEDNQELEIGLRDMLYNEGTHVRTSEGTRIYQYLLRTV